MRMKKYLTAYQKGYDEGVEKGYSKGYQKGRKDKEREEYILAACMYGEQVCPQCNSRFILKAEPMRFCYKCGAKMESEGKE